MISTNTIDINPLRGKFKQFLNFPFNEISVHQLIFAYIQVPIFTNLSNKSPTNLRHYSRMIQRYPVYIRYIFGIYPIDNR